MCFYFNLLAMDVNPTYEKMELQGQIRACTLKYIPPQA